MSDDSETEFLTLDESLVQAAELKTQGNTLLKEANLEAAIDVYTKALKLLSQTAYRASEEPEKKKEWDGLYESLQLNKALAALKTSDFHVGIEAASRVLEKNPNSVKAFYRRGLCRAGLAQLEEAKADLTQAVRLEPANTEARRELQAVKDKIVAARKQEQAVAQGVFAKDRAGLYDDLEAMRAKLEAEERVKYEKEMAVMAEDDKKPSFEEWRQDQQVAKKPRIESPGGVSKSGSDESPKEPEASKDEDAAAASSTKASPSKTTASAKNGTSSDVEFDEEDLKIIEETKKKGYCYFRKTELTEHEKVLKQTNVPTKIETSPEPVVEEQQPPRRAVSQWNTAGGTYEERDTSTWCFDTFKRLVNFGTKTNKTKTESGEWLDLAAKALSETNTADGPAKLLDAMKSMVRLEFESSKCGAVSGEAQCMVVRGSVRRLYELSLAKTEIACTATLPHLQTGYKYTLSVSASELTNLSSSDEKRDIASNFRIRVTDRPKIPSTVPGGSRIVEDLVLDGLKQVLEGIVRDFEAEYEKAF